MLVTSAFFVVVSGSKDQGLLAAAESGIKVLQDLRASLHVELDARI